MIAEKEMIPGLFPLAGNDLGSSPNTNEATVGRQHSLDTYVSTATASKPRLGSRADRMAQPVAREVVAFLAERGGVCCRPIPFRMTDTVTGVTTVIDIPCGATLASKCPTCAAKNRQLKRQQITEGWHLTDEPSPPVEQPDEDVKAVIGLRCAFVFGRDEAMREGKWDQVAELDREIDKLDEQLGGMRVRGGLPHPATPKTARRTRSTKRRADAVELPRLPVVNRTVGRTFKAKDGKVFQPSMFLTLTLPSYGKVHTGIRTQRGRLRPCECGELHGQQHYLLGTPLDGESYNYRQAAMDAIHFAKVLDRFWQNLRRAAGWKVQYAGSVEMQKRLAPHAHYAMRGTLPRKLLEQVAAATYHQVWWPNFDTPVYSTEQPPVWDEATESYVDPTTKQALKTWAQAIDELSHDDAAPAHVARLGRLHADGVNQGDKNAQRSINYITKYVTKDLLEQADPHGEAQTKHHQRLCDELAVLPCSATCANWLLYGVQPEKAKKGLIPGRCTGKVHQPRTLGFTGRRVLVSRQWSGKTLADHRADQKDWIRHVLAESGVDGDLPELDTGRYVYQIARLDDPDVPPVLIRVMNAIELRKRHKTAIRLALGSSGCVPATEDRQQP